MDTILKKYKNEILQILLENGFDRTRLVREESISSTKMKFLRILIKDTPFYFLLKNSPDSFDLFTCEYNLFRANYPSSYIKDKWRFFDEIKQYVIDWINEVRKYFEEKSTSDLWDQLNYSSTILNVSEIDFENKENFSYDESKQIKLSIDELKLLIGRNFELQDEEKKIVNNRLDYLTEASNRLNKYDWKSVLINTILGIIIALSLDSQKGKLLIDLFGKVFSFTTQFLLGK